MSFRLFVHARNIRASVKANSPKIVTPAFQKASVSVSRPTFEAAVGFAEIQAMVARRNLISSTYFRDANATNLVLDPDTLNRYFRGDDPVVISEQTTFDVFKVLSDQPLIQEFASLDVNKVFADTAAVTEEIFVTLIINRLFTDNFGFSDDSRITTGKGLSDLLSFADDHSAAFGKALNDTPTLSEDAVIDSAKALEESVAVSENFARTVIFIRSHTDALSVSDAPVITYNKNIDQSVTIQEQQSFAFAKPLFDAPTLSEVPTISYSKSASDSLSVAENLTRIFTSFRTFTDSASVSDSEVREVGLAKNDFATILEQSSIIFSSSKFDSVSIAEAESKQISKALGESVSIAEILTFTKRSTASSLLNAGAINVAPINN